MATKANMFPSDPVFIRVTHKGEELHRFYTPADSTLQGLETNIRNLTKLRDLTVEIYPDSYLDEDMILGWFEIKADKHFKHTNIQLSALLDGAEIEMDPVIAAEDVYTAKYPRVYWLLLNTLRDDDNNVVDSGSEQNVSTQDVVRATTRRLDEYLTDLQNEGSGDTQLRQENIDFLQLVVIVQTEDREMLQTFKGEFSYKVQVEGNINE